MSDLKYLSSRSGPDGYECEIVETLPSGKAARQEKERQAGVGGKWNLGFGFCRSAFTFLLVRTTAVYKSSAHVSTSDIPKKTSCWLYLVQTLRIRVFYSSIMREDVVCFLRMFVVT